MYSPSRSFRENVACVGDATSVVDARIGEMARLNVSPLYSGGGCGKQGKASLKIVNSLIPALLNRIFSKMREVEVAFWVLVSDQKIRSLQLTSKAASLFAAIFVLVSLALVFNGALRTPIPRVLQNGNTKKAKSQRSIDITEQNVASVYNKAIPAFDASVIDPKSHRNFQLAKGEAQIVARPGDVIHLHVQGTLDNGWWTYPVKAKSKYALTNRITLDENASAFLIDDITYTPEPVVSKESSEIFGEEIRIFEGEFYYDIPILIKRDAQDGVTRLKLHVRTRATCAYR